MAVNLRSPKYLSTSETNTAYTTLDIYIWEGDSATVTTPIYNLRKSPVSGSDFVNYEVSELVRDYVNVSFDGDYNGYSVWYNAIIKVYNSSDVLLNTVDFGARTALDSYSYFEEGQTFDISNESILISNREVFALADNIFRVPIHTANNPIVIFLKDGELVYTQSFTATTESSTQIKYVSILGDSTNWDNYKERVLSDGGLYEDSLCLYKAFDGFDIGEVDKIYVLDNNGMEIIKVKTVDECKFEPKKVTFVNKFGVLQDMYFFKKSVEDLKVKRQSYKSNTRNQYDLYSVSDHTNKDFNVMGNESITLNSGYLSEAYNEVFKQLLLSEQVWLTEITATGELVIPLNIKSSGITYKTSVNDKLVDYKISFDKSFDTINNIR
jgi:hypothetical protein